MMMKGIGCDRSKYSVSVDVIVAESEQQSVNFPLWSRIQLMYNLVESYFHYMIYH